MNTAASRVVLRRRARKAFRSARRLAVAGRALGPVAPAAWAGARIRAELGRGPADTQVTNTSFTWVVADESTTTVVWLQHYWADAYSLQDVSLRASLLDTDGAVRASWDVALAPHALAGIDIREECRSRTVSLPFEGQLLVEALSEGLAPGRPVQVFGEYRFDGESTGVHGQYGWMHLPAAQLIGAMRVDPTPGARSSVVITNGYRGPGAPTSNHVVTVFDAAGRQRSAEVRGLTPGGSRRVVLEELFPGLPEFLHGEHGHVMVTVPCPVSRLLNLVHLPDGRTVVNHGTIDRTFDQAPGVPAAAATAGLQPVCSVPVWEDDRRSTVLTLPNRWGPNPGAYQVTVHVHALDGTPVAEHVAVVPKDGVLSVRLADVVAARPFIGHAEVRVRPVDEADEWPSMLDVLVGFLDDGVLAGEVQVGSEFYNVEAPQGLPSPGVRRTRVTGRVAAGAGVTSWLTLAYPLAHGDAPAVRARLTLLDADGAEQGTHDVELLPHGGWCGRLDELWPDLAERLGQTAAGTVRVRCTEARLYGYSWIERENSRTFPICHLIGG
jgi:hypothetical protein